MSNYIAFIYRSESDVKVLTLEQAKRFDNSKDVKEGNYKLVSTIDICVYLQHLINDVPLSKLYIEIESLLNPPPKA
jgi:hypothetical protein